MTMSVHVGLPIATGGTSHNREALPTMRNPDSRFISEYMLQNSENVFHNSKQVTLF